MLFIFLICYNEYLIIKINLIQHDNLNVGNDA